MNSQTPVYDAAASADLSVPPKPSAPRVRLDFLDGIRGFSALYVVLYHVTQQFTGPERHALGLPLRVFLFLTQYGYYAVPIFIVLSGYCLMLPVARSADGALRGGAGEYLKRRARRILPPYYIALALFIVLPFLTHPLQGVLGARGNDNMGVQAITPISIGTHLLQIHNLLPEWSGKIDPPMWSVATEWQIYFVFPLLLLPVWRKWGNWAAIAAAFGVGLVPHFFFHGFADEASPWYIGLFALGLAGAAVTFSPRPRDVAAGKDIPWKLVGGLFFLAWVICVGRHIDLAHYRWVSETFVGGAVACFIVVYARMLAQGIHPPFPLALRLLSSKPATALGAFSYSLYLVHFPLLYTTDLVLRSFHLSPALRYISLLGAGVPLIVLLAYGFHLAFERRFMSEFAKPKLPL